MRNPHRAIVNASGRCVHDHRRLARPRVGAAGLESGAGPRGWWAKAAEGVIVAKDVRLRRFSNQPVAEIVQCGEPSPSLRSVDASSGCSRGQAAPRFRSARARPSPWAPKPMAKVANLRSHARKLIRIRLLQLVITRGSPKSLLGKSFSARGPCWTILEPLDGTTSPRRLHHFTLTTSSGFHD
jgi:hypothetical protein